MTQVEQLNLQLINPSVDSILQLEELDQDDSGNKIEECQLELKTSEDDELSQG